MSGSSPCPGRGHLSLPDLDTGDQNMPRDLPLLRSRTARIPALSRPNKTKPPAQVDAGPPRPKRCLRVKPGVHYAVFIIN